MSGLLYKDFCVIGKQLKLFLFLIPVMAIVGGYTMSSFAILLGSVLPMTAIAYDERSKWNELANMMPYAKSDLVLSKYFLGYICMAGATVLVILGQLLLNALGMNNAVNDYTMLFFSIFSGLVFIAVNTPILFKFGSEKGRYVFIFSMALIGAMGSMMKTSTLLATLASFPFLLLLLGLVLNIVSILVSLSIKQKES